MTPPSARNVATWSATVGPLRAEAGTWREHAAFVVAGLLVGIAWARLAPSSATAAEGVDLLARAFALQFLSAAWLGFRVTERLFRRDGMPVLHRFPVDGSRLASDRWRAIATDATMATGLATVVLVPSLAVAPLPVAATTLAYLVVTAPTIAFVAFGATLMAIDHPRDVSLPPGLAARQFDVGPSVALVAAALALLLLQLGFSEPLRALDESGAFRIQRSAWLPSGLVLVVTVWLGAHGLRRYRRGAVRLAMAFDEAERYRSPIAADRFEDEYAAESAWAATATPAIREIHRVHRLAFARGAGGLRFVSGLLGALLGLVVLVGGSGRSDLAMVAVAASCTWLVAGTRLRARLDALAGNGPRGPLAAAAPPAERDEARVRAIAGEIVLHAMLQVPLAGALLATSQSALLPLLAACPVVVVIGARPTGRHASRFGWVAFALTGAVLASRVDAALPVATVVSAVVLSPLAALRFASPSPSPPSSR